jgi:hypothetical protein
MGGSDGSLILTGVLGKRVSILGDTTPASAYDNLLGWLRKYRQVLKGDCMLSH